MVPAGYNKIVQPAGTICTTAYVDRRYSIGRLHYFVVTGRYHMCRCKSESWIWYRPVALFRSNRPVPNVCIYKSHGCGIGRFHYFMVTSRYHIRECILFTVDMVSAGCVNLSQPAGTICVNICQSRLHRPVVIIFKS